MIDSTPLPPTPATYAKVAQTSADPITDSLHILKSLFPEAWPENGDKLDFERLRALLEDHLLDPAAERYIFSWAGKRDAVNLLRTPSRATLVPDQTGSVDFDTSQNLFIEGDNLEVLKLLYKPYFGRVKMIYIDPPYNTGHDFVYPDNYSDSLDSYLKLTGQKDSNGNHASDNLETTGRHHSNWLSMMYPRLFLARQLLRDDGVIFVSIDDNEVAHLRLLLDQIFGEENFLATLVWQRKYGPANDATQISQTHEYVVCYARDLTLWSPALLERTEAQLLAYKNLDNDARGIWRVSDLSARTASESTIYPITIPSGRVVYPPTSRSWIVTETRYQELLADNRIWFGVDGNGRPMQKKFLTEVKEGITPQTWWDREFAGDTKTARYEIKDFFLKTFLIRLNLLPLSKGC